MSFSFIICNESEIMDRATREVLGRVRRPRWHGDPWRAALETGTVEAPTPDLLRVAIQRGLEGATEPETPCAADRRRPLTTTGPVPTRHPAPPLRADAARPGDLDMTARRIRVVAGRGTPWQEPTV